MGFIINLVFATMIIVVGACLIVGTGVYLVKIVDFLKGENNDRPDN